jgi:hypothetical protein
MLLNDGARFRQGDLSLKGPRKDHNKIIPSYSEERGGREEEKKKEGRAREA